MAKIKGTAGNDTLNGTASDDVLKGFEGNDLLRGRRGSDTLDGGTGDDTMIGGRGNDHYRVDSAADVITEQTGGGIDKVKASIAYTLSADVERLLLIGGDNIDGRGNALDNVMTGNSGHNGLWAMAGNDVLNGGAGDDSLGGGAGNDTLIGGAGSDHFSFSGTLDALTNVDTIEDFVVGTDVIDLSGPSFPAVSDGVILPAYVGAWAPIDPDFFHIGNNAADANDYLIYNSSTGKLFYDGDGNGAGEKILFAQLDAGLALTSADFHNTW